MKKSILSVAFILLLGVSYTQAQYYYTFYNDGENPHEVNSDGENPYPSTQNTGWTTIWSGDGSSSTEYSTIQTIPFPFEFNGQPVTKFSIGNFGAVTFGDSVPSIKPSTFSNFSLPAAEIADNSVCVLGIKPKSQVSGSTTYKSAVMVKTYGSAPNRQHWIWFNFYGETNIQNGWTYWAIVLEETTNNIYIVDMKTLCVNANSQLCSNNVKLSAGIQIDNSTAYSIANSPNLGANQTQKNIFTDEDNSYYQFTHGTHPENSVRITDIIFEPLHILSDAPFTIKATIQNHGSKPVSNIEASYRINGGSWVTATVTTPNIGVNNYAEITHPTAWTPSATGEYTIEFQVKKPNGGIDPIDDDDLEDFDAQVVDTFVNRRILIESFTSSTCGPCRIGNQNIMSITGNYPEDRYVYLKYQYSFPGTGDPYYTTENGIRGNYYGGVNSIPATMIDGDERFNPGVATTSLIEEYMNQPAFVDINVDAYMAWKDNFNFDITLKPYVDLPAGIKMHAAIVETVTYKNIKTNGETEFHNVLKKFAYGTTGKVLPAISKNTTHSEHGNYQFHGDYRLPANAQASNIINWNIEHSIENFWNLGVIVFLQDDKTKEVLQAQFARVNMRTSANQTELQKSLMIFPNPADDMMYISFNKASNAEVIIRNIQGAVVKQDSFDFNGGNNTYILDTKDLSNGVYTVTINSDGASVTQKVIVTH